MTEVLQPLSAAQQAQLIKEKARSVGFAACGIAPVHALNDDLNFLKAWIDKGFHGRLQYMERNTEKRGNPANLLEGASSVISVLLPYPVYDPAPDDNYRIARYVNQSDYHLVIREKLEPILELIQTFNPQARSMAFVDAGPVFDKRWAQEAGLGWIGKNTLLISPEYGSFVNIGEIITTLPLEADTPMEDRCGSCTRCMEACPTQALTAARSLNATRCIAHLTIENKEGFDENTPADFGGFIFGCDICQEVCPHNQAMLKAASQPLTPSPFANVDWQQLSEEAFRARFSDTPLMRTGLVNLRRNAQHGSSRKL